jgi:hypothetical protein
LLQIMYSRFVRTGESRARAQLVQSFTYIGLDFSGMKRVAPFKGRRQPFHLVSSSILTPTKVRALNRSIEGL